jgi:hypothetical protein
MLTAAISSTRPSNDDLVCTPSPDRRSTPPSDISKDVDAVVEYVIQSVPEAQYVELLQRVRVILENKLIGHAESVEKAFHERRALLDQFAKKS